MTGPERSPRPAWLLPTQALLLLVALPVMAATDAQIWFGESYTYLGYALGFALGVVVFCLGFRRWRR